VGFGHVCCPFCRDCALPVHQIGGTSPTPTKRFCGMVLLALRAPPRGRPPVPKMPANCDNSPRMTHELIARGHACSENRVARLMRAEGLRARPRKPFRPKTTRPDHAAHPSPNLLAQPSTSPGSRSVSSKSHSGENNGIVLRAIRPPAPVGKTRQTTCSPPTNSSASTACTALALSVAFAAHASANSRNTTAPSTIGGPPIINRSSSLLMTAPASMSLKNIK
jgi:hypothetical protein